MTLSSMPPAKLICLLLFLLFLRIRAQTNSSSGFISLGSSLYANSSSNSSWLSPSRLFAFGFYPQGDGFAVGIWLTSKPKITVVWTANRDDPPVSSNSSINFTKDRVLLRTEQGEEIPVTEYYYYDDVATSASMLDSGNFIVYGNKNEAIWQSFDDPTDTILGGQNIWDGLTSSKSEFHQASGRYRLEVNKFGDLVAYPLNHTGVARVEYYWSVIAKELPLDLYLTRSGVLQLRSENKTLQIIARSSYSVENETVIYRATLDPDGILRLYSHRLEMNGTYNMTVEWSALNNPCKVYGFCGLNSYCSTNSSKPDCSCFPGFEFMKPDMRSLGCDRSFKDEHGCKRKDPEAVYNFKKLENTKLGGMPYAKLSVNEEDCSKSCLYDCYCGAVLYLNQSCYKLKLPLMFGMKDQNVTATAYVKWSSKPTLQPHELPL